MRGRHCALVVLAALVLPCAAAAQDGGRLMTSVNTIKEMFSRIDQCYGAALREFGPADMEITVRLSFKRTGEMLGPPRITYESRYSNEEQSGHARTVVMETLKRWARVPFTHSTGGVSRSIPSRSISTIAHLHSHPFETEKRAWLSPKIL